MRQMLALCAAIVAVLAGCATTMDLNDSDAKAERRMRLADSLEATSMLREAMLEYGVVVKLYPQSAHYPNAIRNIGLLYTNPVNPAMDDSAAMYWFNLYLALPVSIEEKKKVENYVTLLQRMNLLRKANARRMAIVDSLQSVVRKKTTDLSMRARRVLELEAELQQTTEDLQRLRTMESRSMKGNGKTVNERTRRPLSPGEREKLRAEEMEKLREVDMHINQRKEKQ